MGSIVVGQLPAFFTNGACAALLLCAGLAIGLTLGKRLARQTPASGTDAVRLAGVLTHLADWTHHMVDDVSEYRTVVTGVANLFRRHGETLDDEKRQMTAGLLARVIEANEQLQYRLNRAEQILTTQASEITTYMSEARTDTLTGLPNRRALDEELSRRLAEWQRHERAFSLMMIDIDHFKRFNDTHGHQAGDAVLQQVGACLRRSMRESDVVARFGGEELTVVLPGTSAEEARQACERARRAIRKTPFVHDGQRLSVTVSVGGAECLSGESVGGLLHRADDALYAAKHAGRDCAFWNTGQCCQAITRLPVGVESEANAAAEEDCRGARPGSTTETFAQICHDLRHRLHEVASAVGDLS
jgi:diguanylate cyclase